MTFEIDTSTLDRKDIEKVLTKHYLAEEIISRNEALQLLEQDDIYKINNDHEHYLIATRHTFEVETNDAESIAAKITKTLETLQGACHSKLKLFISDNNEDWTEEDTLELTWSTFSIEPISKCASLAKCWASHSAFDIMHQSDSERAKELYQLYLTLKDKDED